MEINIINIICDEKGNELKKPEFKYVIGRWDGILIEANTLEDLVAAICGQEYLQCECAETEWHMRLEFAKKAGLIRSAEGDENIVVYDERIGKIPYSYTETNPDYEIGDNPKLIRIESAKSFLYSLLKLSFIRIWEKNNDDYIDIKNLYNLDDKIKEEIMTFKDKKTQIPLHKKLEE